jgi:hypothetical protein
MSAAVALRFAAGHVVGAVMPPSPPRFQFDREKFKDVVHYICAACSPDKLGNVKLHKTLYYADMLFYVKSGRPITGAVYQKQQFGPTAAWLSAALRELERDGRLRIDDVEFYGFRKKAYESRREPNLSRLPDEEKEYVDAAIKFVCHDHTAREISDFSHSGVWEAADMGEELPYYTAFSLFPVEITDDDVAWGTAEAQKIVAGSSRGSPVSS